MRYGDCVGCLQRRVVIVSNKLVTNIFKCDYINVFITGESTRVHSSLSPSLYCHSPVFNSHLRETPQIKLRKNSLYMRKTLHLQPLLLDQLENKSPDKFFNLLPCNHL